MSKATVLEALKKAQEAKAKSIKKENDLRLKLYTEIAECTIKHMNSETGHINDIDAFNKEIIKIAAKL